MGWGNPPSIADLKRQSAARRRALESRPTLAEQQAHYLRVRGHTLSTDGLPLRAKIEAEAAYVLGEAQELFDAVQDYLAVASIHAPVEEALAAATKVRHEIADVVLAATTFAGIIATTVESCIADKTEADRGRG